MILQALVEYYGALAAKGQISRPGWAKGKVSYALELDADGNLLLVIPLKTQDASGKKMVPRFMEMPAPYKRAVNIQPNFLCDNCSYLFGFDNKGKPERTKRCFEAAKEMHLSLLSELESPAAKAVCGFFNRWNPDEARQHALLVPCLEDLDTGANLTFFYNGEFVFDDPEIAAAWQKSYDQGSGDAAMLCCLVTGVSAVPELIHPAIKGVRGAQSSGAALVSFNAPAFCSFGREQNLNAPVSKYAAFAYTTALNHLLSDRAHVKTLGDTTIVFWAEEAEEGYSELFAEYFDGSPDEISDRDLEGAVSAIVEGRKADWEGISLKPDNHFYILGLAPNAARLSVRFFLQDSFGSLIGRIQKHYKGIEIVPDGRSRWQNIPVWALLRETVNEKSRDKNPSPQMTGDTLRAILTGGRYPATLYQQTQLRIRAEREITRGRAAIIKGYLIRNTEQPNMEVLQVQLNESTTYQPYVLGRLFSVLEAVQQKANPNINTTIRDKYFSSACATPAVVFPRLLDLAQNHLKKMDKASEVYYSKQITALTGMITESYPAHHLLSDQGIFQLGYYHQTQKRYEKKTENKEENGDA